MAFPRIFALGISLSGVLLAGSTGFGVSQSLNWNMELVQRRVSDQFVGPVLPGGQAESFNSARNEEALLADAPGTECLAPGWQALPACAIARGEGAPAVHKVAIAPGIAQQEVSSSAQLAAPESDEVGAISKPLVASEVALEPASAPNRVQSADYATQNSPEAVDLVPPIPAPFSHRPILVVYPANADLIRIARSVSGDPLVHQAVPGSWPRRLDQVNALAGAEQIILAQRRGANIFLRTWVETRKGLAIAGYSP